MKLFTTVKEIKSKLGELHFKRFAIIECSLFNIYIHHIYKADEDEHCHDHPWSYISLILWGTMSEYSMGCYRLLSSLNISLQPAERPHKIHHIYGKKLISLFITGPRKREWGYDVDGTWVDNVTYRKQKNEGKFSK